MQIIMPRVDNWAMQLYVGKNNSFDKQDIPVTQEPSKCVKLMSSSLKKKQVKISHTLSELSTGRAE